MEERIEKDEIMSIDKDEEKPLEDQAIKLGRGKSLQMLIRGMNSVDDHDKNIQTRVSEL